MKILILGDIPTPYRIAVFKGISEEFKATTFFNAAKNDSRNPDWYTKSGKEFCFEILDNEKAVNHYNECVEHIRDYDLVLCYDPWAKRSRALQRLCMRKRIPYILNADGALSITTKFPKKQIKTFYCKRAALCFAGCERAAEYFRTYGVKNEKIVKHPFTSLFKEQILTAPYTKEQKTALREELGFEKKVTFITVGQFIHRKGFDLLLDAWSKTDQKTQLYIIGGGPLEEEYQRIIEEKALRNVYIIGFKKPDELQKYYRASDVFVLPTREDIWGLVINEALANALPTISSNKCTAGNELVKNDYNGYVYECSDTDALAECINKLASDEAMRERFSLNALESIEQYTLENIITSHIDSINRIVSK